MERGLYVQLSSSGERSVSASTAKRREERVLELQCTNP